MIVLEFSEEHLASLAYERFHHPHPRVQLKMEAVLLKAHGLAHQEICEIVGICGNTLRSYLRAFESGGVEALKRFEAGGSTSDLDEHTDDLCEYFAAHPPHTVAEAGEAIYRITGVRRGQTQVREFLRRIGCRRIKVGSLPAKADVDQQEHFKKTSWSPA